MILAESDEEGPFRYTEAEAQTIAKLAETRVKADAGDRKAKAQIAALQRKVKALMGPARRGNARAARQLRVLQESGLLVSSQTFAMTG